MQEKVVLLGNGEVAVRIGDWLLQRDDYELTCVVPTVPETSASDSLIRWCSVRGIPLVESGHFGDIPGIDAGGPVADLALCVGYEEPLTPQLVAKVGRCLNLHNGALPRYRGDSPINWALKNGERMHGVTLHEVTPVQNAGPIVGQVTFPIYPECDEVIDVSGRVIEYGYTLLAQTLPILDRITPTAQDESQSSFYGVDDRDALGERREFTREQSRRRYGATGRSPSPPVRTAVPARG